MNTDHYAAAIKQRLDKVDAEHRLRERTLDGMTLISFQIDPVGKLKWRRVT